MSAGAQHKWTQCCSSEALVSFNPPSNAVEFWELFSLTPWFLLLNIAKLSSLLLCREAPAEGAQRGWSRAAPREAGLGSWGAMGPVQHPLVHKDTRNNSPVTKRRNTGSCGQHPKVKERTGTRSGYSAHGPLQSPSSGLCWLHPTLAQKCFTHTQLTPGLPKLTSLGS